MASRGGGSGDRFRRDSMPYSRFEDGHKRSVSSNNNNPPSRHLWVGNLSHSIMENDLTDPFLRFGELDTVAFQPGRSYAFINFKNDDDAIAALKTLQGFPLAGNPLRIEFAKADKSSASSRDEDYLQRRDDQRSALRGSPFSQRDSRLRSASPETFYADKSRTSDKNTEPSEVLWIGFPALLKVDEMILRKAFSPFGDIEKITVFPGRSYAFVRFRNVMSACRAKDTLQGKLFGNPRVHICFARSEGGSSGNGRTPLSPRFRSNGNPAASENFRQDRNFGNLTAESRSLMSDLDQDTDGYGFKRKTVLHSRGSNTYDNWRFGDEPGPPSDVYDGRGSPTRERGSHFDDFPQKFPQKASFYEEPWDSSEDSYLLHGAKKLKTGSFPLDKELPEYPFSDLEQEKRAFPRASFPEFSQHEVFDNNFGYKQNPDRPSTLTVPHGAKSEQFKASYDNFHSGSMPSDPVERRRFSPEAQPSPYKLWKWEGTIAKGGTSVCRARGFPVGKSLDIMLPEFLDCTARTGLDMLAKHYYQAASAWVVFFAPASDGDIGYYNEFMNYLGEKQRAAVAKLDDKTTLFLVPPSDFSEKVLRVPGKLCISGVVLRLELPGSDFGPLNNLTTEKRGTNLLPIHGDAPPTPSAHFTSMPSSSDSGRSRGDPSFMRDVTTSSAPAAFPGSAQAVGSMSNSYNENRHDYSIQQRNPNPMHGSNWSPHQMQSPFSGNRNVPSHSYNTTTDSLAHEHHSTVPRSVQEDGLAHYTGGTLSNALSGNHLSLQENKPSSNSSLSIAGLQPQQLAQLASSLLGQQRLSGSSPNVSVGEDIQQTHTTNHLENQFRTVHAHDLQNNRVGSDSSTSQFGQALQLQQQPNHVSNVSKSVPTTVQREVQQATPGSSQMQNTGTQEAADGDPQKRLQATLQLAAALLQQIQQGKGS